MAKERRGGLGKHITELIPISKKDKEEIEKEGLVTLSIDSIRPNPKQPRQHFAEDDMTALVESIKQHGMIQPMIVVKRDDVYEIVAGERRWRAAKDAGLTEVAVAVREYSDKEIAEIALVENLQRQDLDAIEEALAYKALLDEHNMTPYMISARVGRSRSYVANMLRLLQLPDYIKQDIIEGELTVGQARPLLALKQEVQQKEAWQHIKEEELNARQVEALVKEMLENKKPRKKKTKAATPAELKALVDLLKVAYGVPIDIKMRQSRSKEVQGRVEITFRNNTELEHVMSLMSPQITVKRAGQEDDDSMDFSL